MNNTKISKLLEEIKKNRMVRINKIECIVGDDNGRRGFRIIKSVLNDLVEEGFTSNAIGQMVGKDRHVIHRWYKHYKIKPFEYTGFKPALLRVSFDKKMTDTRFGRYLKINNKFYRVYYVYPDELFCYVIGLILGDGHVDERKIYIVGGEPHKFLDATYPKIVKFGKYLGNRSVKAKYYDIEDNEVNRGDRDAKYWRIYIYWSALANTFRNKYVLKEVLNAIWSKSDLLNAFSAGLFDTDGYFTFKNKKPERIGIDQTVEKWWFPLFVNRLSKVYLVRMTRRARKYRIEHRKKVYSGVSTSNNLRVMMSSWSPFVDKVVLPYCTKPIHLERAPIFKEHSLRMKRRWHYI
ncbi:hypothetical protein H0N98_03110 [Candidatus Micrarchaeota archaeon]|nr:hypothetical protein [Candidatus Micrarchaeota archaeon]